MQVINLRLRSKANRENANIIDPRLFLELCTHPKTTRNASKSAIETADLRNVDIFRLDSHSKASERPRNWSWPLSKGKLIHLHSYQDVVALQIKLISRQCRLSISACCVVFGSEFESKAITSLGLGYRFFTILTLCMTNSAVARSRWPQLIVKGLSSTPSSRLGRRNVIVPRASMALRTTMPATPLPIQFSNVLLKLERERRNLTAALLLLSRKIGSVDLHKLRSLAVQSPAESGLDSQLISHITQHVFHFVNTCKANTLSTLFPTFVKVLCHLKGTLSNCLRLPRLLHRFLRHS